MQPSEPNQPLTTTASSGASFGLKKIRPLIIGLVILLILIVIGSYYGLRAIGPKTSATNRSSALAPAEVTITKTGFNPATISVQSGQAVVWTNNDSVSHAIASDNPSPATGQAAVPNSSAISPTDSYSYVFNQAGSYSYRDSINSSLEGTVVVK
jgi:plastocyanin